MITESDTTHRVWLIRHGESTWNVRGLVQGHADGPTLTARGVHQAARVATAFRDRSMAAIYSSDLRRAEHTARLIARPHGLTVQRAPALRERCFGSQEGLPLSGLHAEQSGILGDRIVDVHVRPEGGESLDDLSQRVGAFAVWLAQQEHTGDVVVVAHGGSIRELRAHYNGTSLQDAPWDVVPNGSVTRALAAVPSPAMQHSPSI
jgi:2,3-bisphosphoglycerate-dependent phosphoglycerate mutase